MNATPKTIISLISGLCLISTLISCGPKEYFNPNYFPTPPEGSEHLITQDTLNQLRQKAEISQSPEKEYFQLQAAYLLVEQEQIAEAQSLMNSINRAVLTPQNFYLMSLVNIDIERQQGNIEEALQDLDGLTAPAEITPTIQMIYHELRAHLYEQYGDAMTAIQERVVLDSLLTSENGKLQNRQKTLDLVLSLPVSTLESAQQNSGSTLDGWLSLGVILDEYSNSSELNQQLEQWKRNYPHHPALSVIKDNKERPTRSLSGSSSYQKIGLLLPVSGKLSENGTSIQDAITTANNANRNKTGQSISITTYDTQGDTNVIEAYQNAINDGVDLVIGPLTKPAVSKINGLSSLPVPVLSLNYLNEKNRHKNQLYEFGLAPEDEAREAAKFAYKQGKRDALIIAQDDEWGRRTSQAFIDEWLDLGGDVKSRVVFEPKDNMGFVVRYALRLELTKQQTERLNTKPVSRNDVDMIFLAAFPSAARQVKPLLDFYYAGNLTVYATSSIYGLPANTTLDKDLNGVYFCDMPWVLTPKLAEPQVHATVNELWPNLAQTHARLFGLGVDAYHLGIQLPKLESLKGVYMTGVTGELYVTNDNHIARQVECAVFQGGRPQVRY